VTEVIVVKSSWRRTLLIACAGAVLGFVLSVVLGPKLVSLLYQPLEASFSCGPEVDRALSKFLYVQLSLAVGGTVLALLVLFFWRRFMRRRAEARQTRAAG
jgi:hypothetical protein